MFDKYKNKTVAVLWSGGLDSTMLALSLNASGALVTCIYNDSYSLNKLGDELNRRHVKPHFDKAGIKYESLTIEHHETAENADSDLNVYTQILDKTAQGLVGKYDVVALGILGHDGTGNEIAKVLGERGVVFPLMELSYTAWVRWVKLGGFDYHFTHVLTRCDLGQKSIDYIPCSGAKQEAVICFKCHNGKFDTVTPDWAGLGITLTDLAEWLPYNRYMDAEIGKTCGYALGHLVATQYKYSGDVPQPVSFAVAVSFMDIDDVVCMDGDIMVTFAVTENKDVHGDFSTRPVRVEQVRIYLSQIKKFMPDDWMYDIADSEERSLKLIDQLVENNYLPVGFDWKSDITMYWN